MIFEYEDIFQIQNRGVVVVLRGAQDGDLKIGETHSFYKSGLSEGFDARIIGVEKFRKCLCFEGSAHTSYGVLLPRDQVPNTVYPRK